MNKLPQKAILFLIRFYQRVFSPDTGLIHFIFPNLKVCRYNPTCSEYTYQAVLKYGIISGVLLGLKRILRCHPAMVGGNDPLH